MIRVAFILITGLLSISGNSLTELKTNKIPSPQEASVLNHCKTSYEVFITAEGEAKYRIYEYKKIKGDSIPFKITNNQQSEFRGKQVNLKIKNGWIVGFDKGEWGGNLFWFNKAGTQYTKIIDGNIKDLFLINGKIFVTEGLAHLVMSKGQIIEIKKKYKTWAAEKFIDLPNAPYAATLTPRNEFIIVTSKGLIKVKDNKEIEQLIETGFLENYLYPNSIVIKGNLIYIGMRGGVLKTNLDNINNTEWLTEK